MTQKFFLTTPIYYVNGDPHIGHIYTTTLAECFARFKRLQGIETYFLTGVDEHGLKVQTTAEANNTTPKLWCDKIAQNFLAAYTQFELDQFNRFIRTTDEDHIAVARLFWEKLAAAGHIYKASYDGWYDMSDECFVTQQNIVDGIDKEGKPQKMTTDGHVLIWSSEDNYMFKLSAFQDQLLDFYEKNPNTITPQYRQAEVMETIKAGLNDISISRQASKVHWGIPVPGDDSHVMYVWIDALANYLTGAGWPNTPENWPADLHIIGKDIMRFHCIFWPAFLMSAGLAMPRRFLVHGWWMAADNRKMGKSLGNAVSPQFLAKTFGLDALKYFLLSEATPEADASIAEDLVCTKLNSDLANALGNLLNRCVVDKLLPEQKVPDSKYIESVRKGQYDGIAEAELVVKLVAAVNGLATQVIGSMDNLRTKDSLNAIFAVVYQINGYVQAAAPWKLLKSDQEMHGVVMYVAMNALKICGILLLAFMPGKMKQLLQQLGIPEKDWIISPSMHIGDLPIGQPVGIDKSILFQKVEIKEEPQEPIQKAKKEPKKEKKHAE